MKIDVEGAEMDILGKFYAEAPRGRWPQLVIMEYYFDSKAVNLLISKGYKEVLRTKMNIVLKNCELTSFCALSAESHEILRSGRRMT